MFALIAASLLGACAHEPSSASAGARSSASERVPAVNTSEPRPADPAAETPTELPHEQPPSAPQVIPKDPNKFADLDPDNDTVVAPPTPLPDCESRLSEAGIEFSPTEFPLKQQRGGIFTCGAEQAVVFKKGPEGFLYNARPRVTCAMALALGRFETIAQQMAHEHLGTSIKRVTHVGTYSCRTMTRFTGMVSEHSYANAIDFSTFWLADGRKLTVLNHFGKTDEPPPDARARFLRELARRLYDEDVFSVVLTPYFDALHRDHFHLDLARYRMDGTRP